MVTEPTVRHFSTRAAAHSASLEPLPQAGGGGKPAMRVASGEGATVVTVEGWLAISLPGETGEAPSGADAGVSLAMVAEDGANPSETGAAGLMAP